MVDDDPGRVFLEPLFAPPGTRPFRFFERFGSRRTLKRRLRPAWSQRSHERVGLVRTSQNPETRRCGSPWVDRITGVGPMTSPICVPCPRPRRITVNDRIRRAGRPGRRDFTCTKPFDLGRGWVARPACPCLRRASHSDQPSDTKLRSGALTYRPHAGGVRRWRARSDLNQAGNSTCLAVASPRNAGVWCPRQRRPLELVGGYTSDVRHNRSPRLFISLPCGASLERDGLPKG